MMKKGTIRFTATARGTAAQLTHTPGAGAVVCTWPCGSEDRREFGTVVLRDGEPRLRPLNHGQYLPFEASAAELAAVTQVLVYFTDWYAETSE
nr:MAG TPA: hypothetical protein [Caudoviricetes sp.]